MMDQALSEIEYHPKYGKDGIPVKKFDPPKPLKDLFEQVRQYDCPPEVIRKIPISPCWQCGNEGPWVTPMPKGMLCPDCYPESAKIDLDTYDESGESD